MSDNTYTPQQLAEVLRLHSLWIDGKDGGVRASLDGASLDGASLCERVELVEVVTPEQLAEVVERQAKARS